MWLAYVQVTECRATPKVAQDAVQYVEHICDTELYVQWFTGMFVLMCMPRSIIG